MTARGFPNIAVDLRGHGESPLGDPEDFSPAALADDVVSAVLKAGVSPPFVVLGHSMGSRIAVRLAADHPEKVCALIVEDYDTVARKKGPPPNDAELRDLERFRKDEGREFRSFDECKAALLRWYDSGRIDGYRGNRIREVLSRGTVW